MKLYATTTNENASEARKGGNHYLKTTFRNKRRDVYAVRFTENGICLSEIKGMGLEKILFEERGKEKCTRCNDYAFLSGVNTCPKCTKKWIKGE